MLDIEAIRRDFPILSRKVSKRFLAPTFPIFA